MSKPTRPKQNDTVNRATLARMMRVSLPTIDDWQRRGCPVEQAGDRGRSYSFNVQAVIEWRIEDERRRQGLSAIALTNSAKPAYNPLRALAHDAAISNWRYAYTKPMVEDMIKVVREKTGCDDKAAKLTVVSIFHMQWILLALWVSEDRFSKELAAGGDQDFDAMLLKFNPRAQFIPGPLPTDKIEDGTYLPKAMEDLFNEMSTGKAKS